MKKINILSLIAIILITITNCKKKDKTSDKSDYIELQTVLVNGGTFQMGSNNGNNNEQPAHTVTVNSFRISKYEVTNQQYADFLNEANIDNNGSSLYININDSDCAISYSDNKFVVENGKEDYPVNCISWFGAKAFCEHYGGRLPTEAEWEFATKGGNNSNNFLYSGSNNADDIAWYLGNSGDHAHKVGTKNENELNLFDMSGNVWEWCNDWYGENYYSTSPSNNPQGPTTGTHRVVRGGSFHNNNNACRNTFRSFSSMNSKDPTIGFRAVFNP